MWSTDPQPKDDDGDVVVIQVRYTGVNKQVSVNLTENPLEVCEVKKGQVG